MATEEATWRAVLTEVANQVALVHRDVGSRNDEGWVEVTTRPPPAHCDDGSHVMWPPQQWHIAFEILFCQVPPSIASLRSHQDDLLLLVYKAGERPQSSRIFARRRTAKLPPELQWGTGIKCPHIDWMETLLLNLVLQTDYSLTVCKCSQQELGNIVAGAADRSNGANQQQQQPGLRVCKKVHASPSKVPVNVDDSKVHDAEPELSYPDICFAVDDFTTTFDGMVLKEEGDCYCVLLYAEVNASWGRALHGATTSTNQQADPIEAAAQQLTSLDLDTSSLSTSPAGEVSQVLVFSGYVSHQLLSEALAERAPGPLRFLYNGGKDTIMVVMHGPDGLGSADVAVTSYPAGTAVSSSSEALGRETSADQQQQGNSMDDASGPSRYGPPPSKTSEAEVSNNGVTSSSSPPLFFKQASMFAKKVAAAATGQGGRERQDMKCALMSLAVPVSMLTEGVISALT